MRLRVFGAVGGLAGGCETLRHTGERMSAAESHAASRLHTLVGYTLPGVYSSIEKGRRK